MITLSLNKQITMKTDHTDFMKIAIKEAEKAAKIGEVPIGAVLVNETGNIISAGHNRTISLLDPTAHAEVLVLRESAQKLMNYRLLDTSLYVTLEPCIMCMGAIVHARISSVIFGAKDPKWGAAGSLYNFADDERLNHRVEVVPGVCEEICRSLMQDFFKNKRKDVATVSSMK